MAGNLLRFRCYQCGKLLGIAPSKAGRTTACPNCKAELIVPDPTEPPEPEVDESLRAFAPIVDEPMRIRPPEPEPADGPSFNWDAFDPELPKSDESEPQGEFDLNIDTGMSTEPIAPKLAVEPPPVREVRTGRRNATDLVISQSVLASLTLFVLLALAVAFLAGLLIGHFVWKVR